MMQLLAMSSRTESIVAAVTPQPVQMSVAIVEIKVERFMVRFSVQFSVFRFQCVAEH